MRFGITLVQNLTLHVIDLVSIIRDMHKPDIWELGWIHQQRNED